MARLETQRKAPPKTAAGLTSKLVFVGFMGAGKSTAARRAAERLGVDAVDSDSVLEGELGESIESFFDRSGERAFREHEEAVVLRLLERPGRCVVGLGGGAVESRAVREQLRNHLCVYLEIDPEQAWSRSRGSDRPLARDYDRFAGLHSERLPLYESVARAVLPPIDGAALDRALEAAIALGASRLSPAIRMAWAATAAGGYPVYVGRGALAAAGALWPVGGRPFVIADERAQELHGERLAAALPEAAARKPVIVASGEQSKTLAEAERVLRSLATAGMERSDAVLAFGGGVVGDLAGLCAHLYQRGVALVQVPTTVVAQVDAAYGGKTGVDLPEAKNYAGAFHQPQAVFTDPGLLETLSERELRAGFAEVVKTALIAGGALWKRVRELGPFADALAAQDQLATDVVRGCLRTKLSVVSSDELDLGPRASLNLGHTFAHALETASGYRGPRHGEAVAVGLMVALRLSERELGLDPDLRQKVAQVFSRQGLPTTFSGPSTEEILRCAELDKKRRGGRQNLVLLRAPGDVVTGCGVARESFRQAIDEVREGKAP